MRLTLIRDTSLPDCTLGILYVEGVDWTAHTIERPWVASPTCRGGQHMVSCVPEGVYMMVRHDTPKHPTTWALENQQLDVYASPTAGKRDSILIHPANYAHELEGCIAPGVSVVFNTQWMVTNSREAFAGIKSRVPWTDEHTIEIKSLL